VRPEAPSNTRKYQSYNDGREEVNAIVVQDRLPTYPLSSHRRIVHDLSQAYVITWGRRDIIQP
jgi:hypothetical protein